MPKAPTLKINEIFKTIQGESSYAGRPCIFIRLTGCNLRCSYCDTVYAYKKGRVMNLDEIIRKVENFNCNLVEITGGEPLLQKNVKDLIRVLNEKGYEVMVETNGSLNIGSVVNNAKIIMDIKCPGSNEEKKNNINNLDLLKFTDEIKFVIKDKSDYNWAKEILRAKNLEKNFLILFSPVHKLLSPKELSGWILKDNLNVRLQTQWHKYINFPLN
jgi:7-carboxy-7-deazaguanine synthase